MSIQPANPLEQFVLDALMKHGWDKLKPEDQENFFPQFTAEAERRLGVVMVPYITDEAAADMDKMLKEETAPEAWFDFWQKHVPNFTEIVKKTMDDFASEMSTAINA